MEKVHLQHHHSPISYFAYAFFDVFGVYGTVINNFTLMLKLHKLRTTVHIILMILTTLWLYSYLDLHLEDIC